MDALSEQNTVPKLNVDDVHADILLLLRMKEKRSVLNRIEKFASMRERKRIEVLLSQRQQPSFRKTALHRRALQMLQEREPQIPLPI